MGTILAIDTVASRLQLALLRDDGAAHVRSENMQTGQAERLFPALAELLAEAGATYADLTRVAVTTGPGSFTGLRIGLSAARGLALALNIPVLGIPTLVALSLAAQCQPLAILLDARRDAVYFQKFSGPALAIGAPQLLDQSAARQRIAPGEMLLTSPLVDIAAVARFAATADPALYPPEATYVREADAKPQEKFRVARAPEVAP